MHPEIAELLPKLKEVLYDCATEIRATKAALYLYDGADRFELVTEYGFRGAVRQSADRNDPVVDRCGRGRTPFFINGVGTEPRFAELLYESSTDRLLASPVYSRGQLVGVIDMRDKAAKALFEQSDVAKAQAIADRMIALFANKNVFGHRFIALSEMDAPLAAPSPSPSPIPPPPPPAAAPAPPPPRRAPEPPPVPRPRSGTMPGLATIVIDARAAAGRIAAPFAALTDAQLAGIRDVLRGMLFIPGAVVAVFSALEEGMQEIAARGTLADPAATALQSKIDSWLSKRGKQVRRLNRTIRTPLAPPSPPIVAAQLEKVLTAPVAAGSLQGLYLTVAFAMTPDRTTHEILAIHHEQLKLTIEHAARTELLATTRQRVAWKLLEPEFVKVADLRKHTEAVLQLADAFGKFVALSEEEAEVLHLAAIVHDCGMRLLDYDHLYRRKDLSPDELSILREHVAVGAAMVEPLLGPDVARAVLGHHERVDGRGYPYEMVGEEIPIPSRVLQIADAFVAMTDTATYQPPQPRDMALSIIARSSGTQFDAELARRFAEMMRR